MKKLGAIFTLMCLFSNFAFAKVSVIPSIYWQKIELEKHINQKISNNIAGVVERKEFSVDTQIEILEPKIPDFYNSKLKKKSEEKDKLSSPLEKASGSVVDKNKDLESDKSDDLKKQKEKKKKEKKLKVNKIKPTDILPDKLPQDYIVFAKLGLEAPLIDDFDNFRRETIIKEIVGNNAEAKEKFQRMMDSKEKDFEAKKLDLQNKLKAVKVAAKDAIKAASKKKISEFEQMWKYNSNLDVFKNLDKITILVRVDENINAADKDKIKAYIENLDISYSGVKAAIKLSFIPFNQKIIEKDQIETAAKFANVLAAVLFAILLGVIFIISFRKIESIISRLSQRKMTLESNVMDEDKDPDAADSSLFGGGDPSAAAETSVDRFISYMHTNHLSAVGLVRRWISGARVEECSALKLLAEDLTNDLLFKLFEGLHDSERESWKALIDDHNLKYEKITAVKFINDEIVKDLIVPSIINDQKLITAIMKLSSQEVATCIKENKEIGKLFFNVYTPGFLTGVISLMEDSLVRYVVHDSVGFTNEFVTANKEMILKLCHLYHNINQSSPFVEKMKKMIYMATPSQESLLFSEFLKIRPVDDAVSICLLKIPFSLVSFLDTEILSDIIKKYDFSKRVDLVHSVGDDLFDTFLESFAPAGSKARDMYNFDIEAKGDDYLVAIKENSEKNLNDFKVFVNKYFTKYEDKLPHAKLAGEEWLSTIQENSSSLSLVS